MYNDPKREESSRLSSVPATLPPASPPGQQALIREQLEKVLASPIFLSSPRKAQLLRYLVEAALAGRADINEYAIGLDVFERPASFDPRIDSTVRAEMSRFRKRLKEYYSDIGSTDLVLIDFGSRGYVPSFVFRDVEPPLSRVVREGARPGSALATERRANSGRILALAMVLLIVMGGTLFLARKASVSNSHVRSLVVLPFVNLSTDAQNENLADGLTEELTNELAQSQDLRVVARTSAFQFKGKGIDVREVGRLLNVDEVLEGSIDRHGGRVRVTAQLNRASNGYHIWSHEFETNSVDTIVFEDDIAKAIATAIRGNR